jgi:aldehyde:ferredoxin oxidoreductase
LATRSGAATWVAVRRFAHYLLREVPKDADPLGPDSVLVFACGILMGLPFPGAGRHSVGAKSPLMGAFGAAARRLGRNRGPWSRREPVYLWIADDQVEFRDAAHLWGKATGEVEHTIRQTMGTDWCASLKPGSPVNTGSALYWS